MKKIVRAPNVTKHYLTSEDLPMVRFCKLLGRKLKKKNVKRYNSHTLYVSPKLYNELSAITYQYFKKNKRKLGLYGDLKKELSWHEFDVFPIKAPWLKGNTIVYDDETFFVIDLPVCK